MVRRASASLWLVLMLALLAVPAAASAQSAPPDSDFEVTALAKGSDKTGEPIAMAVLPDRRVLHTSRDGRVWLTTPNATTTLAGTVPVYSHDEDGLQGIAIDADFATNRWVYIYYAPPETTPPGDAPNDGLASAFAPFKGHNQLSRVKLTAGGTIDLATEQKIMQVPADRGICCHAGGEIDFDAAGNLYLSTGDDSNPFFSDGFTPIDEGSSRNPAYDAQRTSANTNDLRGKLLRIHVESDGTYTAPAGNMFPEASDPGDKTRPEIYAMGFRNPFRFSVDRETGWVYLGDYGPDSGSANPNRGPGGQVEFNLIKGPGNYGWPYCHGKNDAYNDYNFQTGVSGAKFDCNAPKNESPLNTGLVDLPPAKPAWIAYDNCSIAAFGCGSESPMGGPTYHYDAASTSKTKFPAYYDGKNFAYEFGRGWIRTFTGGADGSMPAIAPFMDTFDFKQLINAEFGPDGALYVLDYGGGSFGGDAFSAVYRVDYVQGRRSPVVEVAADHTSGPAPLAVEFSSVGSYDPDGGTITYEWDFNGDGVTDSTAANPSHTYAAAGRYIAALKVKDSSGDEGNASVNITAGNTAPKLKLNLPADGAVYEYGDTVKWSVTVTDPEDGTIDCNKVHLDTALGHNDHTHGDQSLTGCSGQLTIPPAWEDKTQHSFYILNASYTDGATPGLELTGTAQATLEHHAQQGEFFDAQSGVEIVSSAAAAGGRRIGYVDGGDWLRYDDFNLTGIDSVTARITSYANSGFELRADAPDGQLLATVPVPNQNDAENYFTTPAVPIVDPGKTFDLYVVFTGGSMDLDEFTLNGPGQTGNGSPQVDATASEESGKAPLAVDFTAAATDPEGKALTYAWDFGVAGAPTPTTATASYTYDNPGVYRPKVTVTDADGRKSVQALRIDVSPDCPGTTAPDDTFSGTALNLCRWTTVLREDASHYRVAGGKLEIDALDGDMYGNNTSAKNLILQSAPSGSWEAITKVQLPQGEEYEQAGMFVHSSDQNYAKLALIDIPGGPGWRVEFGQTLGGSAIFDAALDRSGALVPGLNDSGVWLKLMSDGTSLTAAWSADGTTWTPVGRAAAMSAMPNPRVGLAAYNGNGQAAAFDSFTLHETNVPTPCQTGATPDAGYRMLLDGTAASLANWKMSGPGGFTLQPDCSILSYGGLGLLYHPDSFNSYSLKLDWKLAGDDNGGIFLGFKDPGADPFNAVNQGYEIQADATDDPSHTTGAIYNFQPSVTAVRDSVLKPVGEWNAYELVVVGSRIQVFLNGTKVNDFVSTDPARLNAPSMIGLQNHGTGDDVYYRNVQIKDLPTPTSAAPALTLTSPQNGDVVGAAATVTGTTDGTKVQVRAGTKVIEVTPAGDGTFTASIPLALGNNKIDVTAYNADGVGTAKSVTVIGRAFGTLVGSLSDPVGDDNGPGTYTYPTAAEYTPGTFDLEKVDVYEDGSDVRFVTRIAGAVNNPWGGDQISHQRINLYLGDAAGSPIAALPGTNMDTSSPWKAVVVIDGRFGLAGVYAPDGSKVSGGTLSSYTQFREIVFTVPKSSLGTLDLSTAVYGTAMFGNIEGSDGVGNVRPVYSQSYWDNPPGGMSWIKGYRFGGGAGEWTGSAPNDTDRRDPNALDIIVGPSQTQAQVMDYNAASPTKIPMLGLTLPPDTTKPTVSATFDPAQPDGDGVYRKPVTATVTAADDRAGALAIEYRVDGGAWTAYTAPVTVSANGDHTFEYRATDAASNVSDVGTKALKVGPADTTPPTVSATLDPAAPDADGVYRKPVTVTAVGDHTVEYRATDIAGNVSTVGSKAIKVAAPDTTKPTVSATLNPAAPDADGVYRKPVTVSVTGTDENPNVVVEYSLDGGTTWKPYSGPVTVSAVGDYSLMSRATDVGGNVATTAPVAVKVAAPDTTKPTVSATLNPAAPDPDGAYHQPVTLTVTGADENPNVVVEYSLDGGTTWKPYTAPVTVSAVGDYSLVSRATDVGGNVATTAPVAVKVAAPVTPDTTAPTVTGTFDPAQPGPDGAYHGPVTMTLAAQDNSPSPTVEYRIDGGAWMPYTGPVTVSALGDHTLEYIVTDAAGNKSAIASKAIKVAPPIPPVDPPVTGPPTLSLTLGAPASFGAFTAGIAKDYTASTTATVTSTATEAALSVVDPTGVQPGKLVNDTFSLPQPVQVRAGSGAFAPLSATPTVLATLAGPVTNGPVTIDFQQSIAATDVLRTGAYGKTLTFTLSATKP